MLPPMPVRRIPLVTAGVRHRRPRRDQAGVADARRRDILDNAVRLMEEKGFAAMSVQHIADALEFSKANFYHHIDSKEQLLFDIFIETLQYSLSRIEEIVGSERPLPDRVRALVEFYVSLMLERRAVMLVWFKERAHLTAAHQEEVGRLEQRIGATLERFYAQGTAAGEFKPLRPDLLRFAIFGMCFQLTKAQAPADRAAVAEIARQLQDLACTGLLARRTTE
jgi:TetR/AcrR family transcriptional regulator, cholesterol catabolism regulator